MIKMLQSLEPRYEESKSILFRELEEIQEIFFHKEGLIEVGYEISRKPRMVLRIEKGAMIGGFNCIEN